MNPLPVPWSLLLERVLLALKFPRIRCDFLFRAVKGISFIIAPTTAALSNRDIMSAGIYSTRAVMFISRAKGTYYITIKMSIEHWWHDTDWKCPRKPCPSATSTSNPKLTGPGSKASHWGEKTATNFLIYRDLRFFKWRVLTHFAAYRYMTAVVTVSLIFVVLK